MDATIDETVSVPSVIRKAKRIAQKFNQSPQMWNLLNQELHAEEYEEKSLIQSVVTRWNSLYAMLQRLYDLRQPVTLVLSKNSNTMSLLLSEDEVNVIEDILLVLKPFLEITEIMSSEQVPTISLIIPYTTSLLRELTSVNLNTESGKLFGQCLLKRAKKRLLTYEEHTVARYCSLFTFLNSYVVHSFSSYCSYIYVLFNSLATVLDPRFKEEAFFTYSNFTQAADLVGQRLLKKLPHFYLHLSCTYRIFVNIVVIVLFLYTQLLLYTLSFIL